MGKRFRQGKVDSKRCMDMGDGALSSRGSWKVYTSDISPARRKGGWGVSPETPGSHWLRGEPREFDFLAL